MNELSQIFFRGIDPSPDKAGSPDRGGMGRFRSSGLRPLVASRRGQTTKTDPLIDWMFEEAGLELRAYRPLALQRRLPACLRQLRVGSPELALTLLERRPELLPLALNAILIGVSDFFRDAAVFAHLQAVVLPALLRSRPGIRVCSVGVSGGQELYSVAMLLAELHGLRGSELTGIDCRGDAIARAIGADFRSEEMAAVEPARRERFFEAGGGLWRVRPELRRQIRWETADLFLFAGPGPWDLILFRNVAIYLDGPHAWRAWERLEARLAPGGFLVTGKAETPPASLGLVRAGPSIYKKPVP